jgi:hypothetical protein
MSNCFYALLRLISVIQHSDACFNESKPPAKIVTAIVPTLSSGSQLIPGHFSSEFQQRRRSLAPNEGRSATRRHLTRVRFQLLGLGTKYVNADDVVRDDGSLRMVVDKRIR